MFDSSDSSDADADPEAEAAFDLGVDDVMVAWEWDGWEGRERGEGWVWLGSGAIRRRGISTQFLISPDKSLLTLMLHHQPAC